eukprot:12636724-Alexandrium_andersonii.AAC.1
MPTPSRVRLGEGAAGAPLASASCSPGAAPACRRGCPHRARRIRRPAPRLRMAHRQWPHGQRSL